MSTSTPNIGLTLPIGVEKVSRAIINANMTKIDTAFGNMNRATMREVPFTIAVADWSGSGSSWSATYLTDYVTSTSKEILTYTSSLRTAKAEDIDANKKSGGGGIVFTTTKKPVASISGSIYVWDSDDGKIPVIIEGTVTPVENGGTGASSVAGAKNNLGISAVESSVQSLSEHLETHTVYGTESVTVPSSAKDLNILVQYGTSGGLQMLTFTYYIPSIDGNTNGLTLTQGYYLSSSSYGFCQIMANRTNNTISIVSLIINGTDYKTTSKVTVFYKQ